MRDSRYEGLIRGGSPEAGKLEMRYVKKEAKGVIRYGSLVITSGNNSIYPPDLYVGRVKTVEAPEWETSLTLTITPIVDFARMEYVFVLTDEQEMTDDEEVRE
jgi:rod shape-determining protein MreC